MKIKTKLTSGIGLLFMIIVLLGVLAISYIDKLADDTKNIHGEPRKTENEYHGNQRVGSHRPLGPPF